MRAIQAILGRLLNNGTPPGDDHGNTTQTATTLNFNGWTTFTYQLSDGVLTDTALVTITVTPVSDSPVATDNTYTTPEDTPVSGNIITDDTGHGVDSDDDGDPLGVYTYTMPVTGSLTLTPDGSFNFTPPLNWFGTVTFTYIAASRRRAIGFEPWQSILFRSIRLVRAR